MRERGRRTKQCFACAFDMRRFRCIDGVMPRTRGSIRIEPRDCVRKRRSVLERTVRINADRKTECVFSALETGRRTLQRFERTRSGDEEIALGSVVRACDDDRGRILRERTNIRRFVG